MTNKAMTPNTEAPRPYFPYPHELDRLPADTALPDLFRFLEPGRGRVETPEDWEDRRQELLDALKYYLYGSRLDPRKEDTQVTAVRENYLWTWAEGILPPAAGPFGSPEAPRLPLGSYTARELDLSAFGMGKFYADIAPKADYVHAGADFALPGSLGVWRAGEGWEAHPGLAECRKLPTITVEITIRDTDPANAPWRSPAAESGVKHSFDLRFPAGGVTVDGAERSPEGRGGRGWPVVVCMGGLSEEQIVTLNEQGYVYLSVNDATDPDMGQLAKYELLYPPKDPVVHRGECYRSPWSVDSGNLMHSGWMASRALDALENYDRLSPEEKAALNPQVILPKVDVCASAITGCSNNGKRAIVGGVFDTGDADGGSRFRIIAPSDPGGGGASGFRCSTEGRLFGYEPPVQNGFGGGVVVHDYAYGLNETTQRAVQNSGEDQWFSDRAQIFSVRPELAEHVPIDAHSLLAAFATRNTRRWILTWTGEGQDAWLNSPATVLSTWAAREVFEFLGRGEDIAVIVRDQAHANQDRDLCDLIALMDHAFYGAPTLLRKYLPTLAGPDGRLAADGSGAILPTKEFASLRELERNPYFLPSALLPWSRPGKPFLWTGSNSVTQGVPVTLVFHTDAREVTLRLPDGELLREPVSGGEAAFALSADQARAGCYLASARGERGTKEIELSGWTASDALRHAVTDNSALGHDVGSGLAFTTPLVNYDDPQDPPKLYLGGVPLPADRFDYDNAVEQDGRTLPQSGYLQPYGASVMLYEGTEGWKLPLGTRTVFSLRGARLEALQGFVLNLDVELEKFDPNEGVPQAKPRMRFRTTCRAVSSQTPSWSPELRQITPRLGLPAGEERWPLLGNWASDYDEKGNLRPLEEIRPLRTAPAKAAYAAAIALGAGDGEGFTLTFSQPVNPRELGLAVSAVSAYDWTWAPDAKSVRVSFPSPLPAGREVTLFVFRSADREGNLLGGPVKLRYRT